MTQLFNSANSFVYVFFNFHFCSTTFDLRVSHRKDALFHYEGSIYVTDFVLDDWMRDQGYTPTTIIAGIVIVKLIDTLGLDKYLDGDGCDQSKRPFDTAVNGWNKGMYSNDKSLIIGLFFMALTVFNKGAFLHLNQSYIRLSIC